MDPLSITATKDSQEMPSSPSTPSTPSPISSFIPRVRPHSTICQCPFCPACKNEIKNWSNERCETCNLNCPD
ncbi:hypothetical protein ACJZ2D_010150 [Fusarium nematophilum]